MKNKRFFLLYLLFTVVFHSFSEPNTAIDLLNTALNEYSREHYYSAIEYYKTALQKNPVFVDALYGIAETYLKLSEYKTAEDYVSKARKLDKYSVTLKILEGRIFTALGKFKEANENFNAVLIQEPNNNEAKTAVAELYIAEGNILSAINIYNTIIKHSPEDRRSLLSLILVLDNQKQYSEAEEYVEKALRLFPEDSMVQYTAAVHFLLEGNFERVEPHTLNAVSLNQENTEAVLLLTRLYMESGRYGEAAEQLNRVLKDNRNQPLIWYILGEVYRLKGQNNDALRSYSIGLSLSPDDELVRIAFEDFIVNNTDPDNPVRRKYADYHLETGKGYEELNYFKKAKFEYRRALYIDPHSHKGWLLYANLLKTEGFKAKYLSILKEIAKNGNPGTDITDEIEIYESILQDNVSTRWGVNQFEIEKPLFKIMLFGLHEDFSRKYYNSGFYINRYLNNILKGNERIDVLNNVETDNFSQAFNMARRNGTDYFIQLIPELSRDSFRVDVKVYLSSTGTLIKTFTVFRTGNRRVSSAMAITGSTIEDLIPLRGTIIQRNFDRVLLDIGSAENVEKGTVFYITKPQNRLTVDKNFNFRIDMENINGEITVDNVDDLVSEGTVKKYDFFDLIAPGDFVFAKITEKIIQNKKNKIKSINNSPSKLYKTILTIP